VANGITINMAASPWVITFDSGGGSALPYTVLGVQATTNIAMVFRPTRIVWTSPNAGAGDQVILQDLPGVGGTATPRDVLNFVASGADYMPPQEWKPAAHEAGFVGLVITQFDSGTLQIYI
jgi:hypothetical protein